MNNHDGVDCAADEPECSAHFARGYSTGFENENVIFRLPVLLITSLDKSFTLHDSPLTLVSFEFEPTSEPNYRTLLLQCIIALPHSHVFRRSAL